MISHNLWKSPSTFLLRPAVTSWPSSADLPTLCCFQPLSPAKGVKCT